jgi:hypothetical protein
MRLFLQFFALSDRYERKARLLPGLMLAAGPALTAGALVHELSTWFTAAGTAVGVEFLAAVILGHYTRARGRAAEELLWASWGGPPTTRWLRPSDTTCSEQQKSKWRGVIKRLTGITIPAAVPTDGAEASVERVIADATRQLRCILRGQADAAILQSHNEEYGFARNLYGVRFLWVSLAAACVAGSAIAFLYGVKPYTALAVSVAFLVVSILVATELPQYVRRCADRYAESLFAAAVLADSQPTADEEKPKSESERT